MHSEDFDTEELNDEKIFPSIMNRVQAMFFDFWIIVAIVVLLSTTVLDGLEGRLLGLKIALFFAVNLVYDPLMTMSGGTIGQRTMGMKIRRFEDPSRKINITQAYFRSTMKLFLGWISFLSVSLDPYRRAMHDKASGTVVLHSKI